MIKTDRQFTILFYIVLMLYTASNVMWLALDDAPPISDSIYYIQGSQTLIQAVQENGLAGLRVVQDLVPYRPPLQSMVGAAGMLLLGMEPDRVLYLNVVWLSLTAWIVFAIVRRHASSVAGVLAAAFLMSCPFWHEYLPLFETEVPMMVVIAASVYCLDKVVSQKTLLYAFWLGVSLSCGMLLKWIFFLVMAGPVAAVLWGMIRKESSKQKWIYAALILGIPAVLALPWYVWKASELLSYQAEVGESDLFTPFVNGWSVKALWYYPGLLLVKLQWLHALVLASGAAVFWLYGWKNISTQKKRVLIWVGLSLVVFWLFFAVNPTNVAQKYLLPLYPMLAVGLGLSWSRVPEGYSRVYVPHVLLLLLGVMLYHQWAMFSGSAERYEGYKSQMWLEPQVGFFEYPKRPPRSYGLAHRKISKDIAAAVEDENEPTDILVLPWLDRFNAMNLSIWLSGGVGNAKTNGVSKYNIIPTMLFDDLMITSSGPSHREMTHQDVVDPFRYNTTLKISQTLRFEPEWFLQSHTLLHTYPYKDFGEILRLYQRTKPAGVNEAQYVIGLLIEELLPESYLWDQLDVVWRELEQPEYQERSERFRLAFLDEDEHAAAELAADFKRQPKQWFPYERFAMYRLSGEMDVREHAVVHEGGVLGWHPFTHIATYNHTKIPFRGYPVIPYPRDVVSGYFEEEMNCVAGNFVREDEWLLAVAPVAGSTDPLSTTRLMAMQDINFMDSSSIVRQFQPLEDVPNSKNLRNGVYLSAGDIDGDGKDELIAGQTDSAESQGLFSVLDFESDVYDPVKSNFAGFPPGYRGDGSVRLAVADLDGDGRKELVAAANGNGFRLCVIQVNAGQGRKHGFARPVNGIWQVPKMEEWEADDPVYVRAGEFDGDAANGEEVLFGIDKPDSSYRVVKFDFQRNADRDSEVLGIDVVE